MNGEVITDNDVEKVPKKCDTIFITGKPENCEEAKNALLVS